MSRGKLKAVAAGQWSGVALLIAILIAWEITWRLGWIQSMSWPAMSRVFTALIGEILNLTLLSELLTTLVRVLVGFTIASLVAVVIGMLMGSFRAVHNLLEPITELLRPIPVSALVPVAILFFGIHSEMKIAMVVFAAFFPVLISTYSGIREVDPVLRDTGRTFRMTRFQRLRRIEIPAAAPFIAAGLRISLALSLVVAVVAEMVAGGDGIGSYLLFRQRALRVAEMYAAIMSLAILGYVLNTVFVWLERRVVFWSSSVIGVEG